MYVTVIIQPTKCMRLLYCHLWPVHLHHTFPHYIIKGTIFGKKLFYIKRVFYFLYSFCLKHFSF